MNPSRISIVFRRLILVAIPSAAIIIAFGLAACRQKAADPVGVWRGFVKNKSGEQVAFTLEVKREGDRVAGSLVNGDERTTSTGGSFDGKTLKLRYDFYDGELTATLEGDQLRGVFERKWRREILRRELRAERSEPGVKLVAGAAPDISGDWVLRVGEGDKQRIWRAWFRQQGAEVRGTIIPVNGDWGAMFGTFENGQLTLSRFDGINAHLCKANLTADGKLEGLLDSERKFIAQRAESPGAPAPPDPHTYTSLKNLAEPLRFSFPDLDGKMVSSSDERFRNKVVIVSITGSWCPNCYDEAPVLNEFYDRYRAQGLEIVALAFDYTGDATRDIRQVKIFARQNNIKYPMLYAGATDETEKKLPQLDNFGAYPTTIYIGREGLVKRIHVGFEGKATGERFTRLKAEMESLVRELLDQKSSSPLN